MELHQSSRVVSNLLRKRDLLTQGDPAHREIRTALLICGGAMRGAYGAGVAVAFQRLGLFNSFDVVVGISSGAAIGSYFLAGQEQTLLGTAIYYEECLDGFVSFRRWPIVDIDHIERVMSQGKKTLDIAAILAHRSQFFVGVTDWETGEGRFIDAKRAKPRPLTAIKASMAITELYGRPVVVNGNKYTDGSIALPCPIKQALQTFDPTDLFVITNASPGAKTTPLSWTERTLIKLLTVHAPPSVRALAVRARELWAENLNGLPVETVNIGVLWGPSNIHRLTQDRNSLRDSAAEGARKTLAIFGQPNLSFNLL